jgi:hypothetical protein
MNKKDPEKKKNLYYEKGKLYILEEKFLLLTIVHWIASRVTFSIGSPIMSLLSCERAWQLASIIIVSSGISSKVTWIFLGSGLVEKWEDYIPLMSPKIYFPHAMKVFSLHTYFIPAIPAKTRSLDVKVPVLSKQQISILPAKGIRKGSVQKIAKNTKCL